ncbi:hypothetical protein SSX86_023248 [Deinandra increscens subsp. villosa]|uniref:PLAC8 motif-containing protein n=1 Tax=Deinandra increscens subsp. villosa TaxID=3103831 RepID=A0AAP0CKG9_9ASTR
MDINHHYPRSKWSTGLFECGGDGNLSACLITYFFPCITFGQIAEVLDEGKSSFVAHGFIYGALMTVSCHWLYAIMFRQRLRAKYRLPSDPCNDYCVHIFCDSCALCQEYAELKNRGLDPSKGWPEPPNAPPCIPASMERL